MRKLLAIAAATFLSLPSAVFISFITVCAVPASSSTQVEPAAERTKVIGDWEGLAYGMFITFGMSTFSPNEFGAIPEPSTAYNPTKLDVDQWIRTAKSAGMKYAVLTTKHCYGHALWPSKASDYSEATSSVRIDVVKRFVEACRKYGIKPGFYYLLGWDAKDQPVMTPAQYEAFCRRQLTELLSNYGPIVELWLDIPYDMGPENARVLADLYSLVKSLQPDCLVLLNQGNSNGTHVYKSKPTYFYKPTAGEPFFIWPMDLIPGEGTLPPPSGHDPKLIVELKPYYIPMETCMTIGRWWFYRDYEALRTVPELYSWYKSARERGANFLLNVPPDRTGRIPAATVARLIELKAAIEDPSLVPVNLLAHKKAIASSVYRGDSFYAGDKLTDEDSTTRWTAEENDTSPWVEVDLGASTHFNTAIITEGGNRIEFGPDPEVNNLHNTAVVSEDWDRVREFALEIPDGHGGWRAVYKGGRLNGDGRPIHFEPTAADKVRLHVLRATGGPTIWDFELYNRP
jgi:alpha-L-fucosidase